MAKYGWKEDDYDSRDFRFSLPIPVKLKSVDLRQTCKMPKIRNQLSTNGCTGFSTDHHFTMNVLNHHVQNEVPISLPFSPLFLYYGGRQAIGEENQDNGAQIRDVFKATANVGVCSEDIWQFRPRNVTVKPSAEAYEEAIKFKSLEYKRLNNTRQELVGCLLEGFSFVFGFQVFESFESNEVASTGIVQLPAKGEQRIGGHAVCCVGYNVETDRFIVANSWGEDWGQSGYFTIPADYICDPKLASDFWVTKLLM